MSDRVHNTLLDLIALGIGLTGLVMLIETFTGDVSGFWFGLSFVVALFVLFIARGFKKRKGGAFLAVSVALLIGWMVQLIRAIALFDVGGWAAASGTVYSFLLINLLIGYLGRWSMERRFRPHLEAH